MDFTLTEEQEELRGPGPRRSSTDRMDARPAARARRQHRLVRPRHVGRARQGEPARRRAARSRSAGSASASSSCA